MEIDEKIAQIEELKKAFDYFNQATEKLQHSYKELQEEAEKLRHEIEVKNKQLEEKTELLNAVLMNATSAIVAIDENNQIVMLNNSAKTLINTLSDEHLHNIFKIKDTPVFDIEIEGKFFNVSVGRFQLSSKRMYIFLIDDITALKEIEKSREEMNT